MPLLLERVRRLFGRPGRHVEDAVPLGGMHHRDYVGGMWDEIGSLQFEFLLRQGLLPSDCFLDIACGALRGGVHFIRYLQPGGYLGLDRDRALIERGVEHELGASLFEEKRPEFVVSETFEFHRFSRKPRLSLAQSLFSHLTLADIASCLTSLHHFVDPGHILYATFNEGSLDENPAGSHSHAYFRYPAAAMMRTGEQTGWSASYLGDWGHPRHQKMIRYEAH